MSLPPDPGAPVVVVALPKGRLTGDVRDLFARAGLPAPPADFGRRLVVDARRDVARNVSAADAGQEDVARNVSAADAGQEDVARNVSTEGGQADVARNVPTLRFMLAKPADVPTYVEYGAADLGVCGLDSLRESGRDVYEPLLLPFGRCRLSLAGPQARPDTPLRYASQPRVATRYPRLAGEFFRSRGVNAEIIELNGSVELGPLVGLADLIVDLVESGGTLRANGLAELRVIMQVQAVLIANRAAYRLKAAAIQPMIACLRAAIAV